MGVVVVWSCHCLGVVLLNLLSLLLSLFSFPMKSFLNVQVCAKSLFLSMVFLDRVVVVAGLWGCVGKVACFLVEWMTRILRVWSVGVSGWVWECCLVERTVQGEV